MLQVNTRDTEVSAQRYALLMAVLAMIFGGLAIVAAMSSNVGVAAWLAVGFVLSIIFALNAKNSSWHPLRNIQTTE